MSARGATGNFRISVVDRLMIQLVDLACLNLNYAWKDRQRDGLHV